MSAVHRPSSYADLLAGALQRNGHREAFAHGDRSFTNEETMRQILHFAGVLQAKGLKKGDGVAILSSNRPEFFFAMSAAIALGCPYTPIHPLGGLEDQVFVLEDAEIRALIYSPEEYDDRADELSGASGLRHLMSLGPSRYGDDLLRLAATSDSPKRLPQLKPSDVCFLSYTGGTTGRPKGVIRPHRSMVAMAFLILADWELPRELRFLAVTPMSHASGTMMLPMLLRGGTIICSSERFDDETFLDLAARNRVTCTFLVPTMLYRLLDGNAGLVPDDLGALETILYGGSPVTATRLAEAVDRLGSVFMQLYGQAEAPNAVALLKKEHHNTSQIGRLSSCGVPVVGVQVELRDETDRAVSVGEIGEICVRSPLVMDGYRNLPELTKETLRGGLLHTGDMAYRDADGFITIMDRKKDMIVSGGFNVFAAEVESVIARLQGVAACAVIGVPDTTWGEAVKAVVVKREGCELSVADVREIVRAAKGPVCVPKIIEFVSALPLTPLGKPDKVALRAAVWGDENRNVH